MVKTSEVIVESFWDWWKACRETYTHYPCKGGRNSAKSTTISQRCIFDLIDQPLNILGIRKVSNTIQESMYEQLKEATRIMGCQNDFEFLKNPLRITYKQRGNYILFRGADDPLKIKSIKTSNFPIGRIWFEELAEFKTEDEVQTIIDSILRDVLPGNMQYKFYYSYNPPKRKQHWLNKKYETQFIPKNIYVHHSYYYDNPYLSDQTLEEINFVKETNVKKYNWLYLGQPSGGGIVPFENLIFRKITDEEIKTFDNIRQGLDWGYASDPLAFTRWHYDKTRRKLYAMDEIYGTKLSNRYVAEEIIKRNYQYILTIADSSEPKSIAELRDLKINVMAATKGEGSVEYGEKWIDDLDEVVIDYERTPNIAREFENIDYQVDKDGNQKPRLEDKDNHTIDSCRYAVERDMRSSAFRMFG